MATIQKILNTNNPSYRVFIRRQGCKTLSKTFSTKKLAKEFAKAIAVGEEKAKGKAYTPFDRVEWNKLGSDKRQLADEYYLGKYGKTIMEMQEAEPNKNHLMIGKILGKALVKPYQ